MLTITSAPGLLCLLDSDVAVQNFRFKTVGAGKVIRTGNSLEVRMPGAHKTQKGALVMVAADMSTPDRQVIAVGRITNLLNTTDFTVPALYPVASSISNVNPAVVIFLNEASCASWLARALEDPEIAGGFAFEQLQARPGRDGAKLAAELRYIREVQLQVPRVVIGSLSANRDLVDPSVNASSSMATFDANLKQLLVDGHQVVIPNARPVDLSFGTTPNTTQERALLLLNQHYVEAARQYRDVHVIDWYSRVVDKTSTAGGARAGLYKDAYNLNTDGATEVSKDFNTYLKSLLHTPPVSPLRSGLWDGPARGTVAGCNICGALETNASFTPSDTGATGQLSTHCTLVGSGGGRASVSSLIQLVDNDNSYRQRVVITGNTNNTLAVAIEGPTGDKLAAKLVAGGLYRISLRYSIYDMAFVQLFEITADATITYPTLGSIVGKLGSGMTHSGEGVDDVPDLYRPTINRAGIMEFPALIKIPDDALSVDYFGITLNTKFYNSGGKCTLEFDHPTIRRIA